MLFLFFSPYGIYTFWLMRILAVLLSRLTDRRIDVDVDVSHGVTVVSDQQLLFITVV